MSQSGYNSDNDDIDSIASENLYQAQISVLHDEVEDLTKSNEDKSQELELLKKSLQDKDTFIATKLSEKDEEMMKLIDVFKVNDDILQKKVEDLTKSITEYEATIKDLNSKNELNITDLNSKIVQHDADKKDLNNKIAQHEADKKDLSSQIDTHKLTIETHIKKNNDLGEQLHKIETNFKREISQKEQDEIRLKNQVRQKDLQINAQENELKSKNTQIEKITKQLSRSTNSNDNFEELEEKEEQIQELLDELESKEEAYNAVSGMIKQYEDGLSKLSLALEEKDKKIKELTANSSASSRDIPINPELTKEHEDLKVKYKELQENHEKIKNDLSGHVNNFKNIIGVMKTEQQHKDYTIGKLERELKTNSTLVSTETEKSRHIEELENEIHKHKNSLIYRDFEKEISILKVKLQNKEKELTTMKNSPYVRHLEGSIANITKELEELKKQKIVINPVVEKSTPVVPATTSRRRRVITT
jgi:chromosome segregation ATPase